MTEIQQSEPSLLMELGVHGILAQKFFDEKRYELPIGWRKKRHI